MAAQKVSSSMMAGFHAEGERQCKSEVRARLNRKLAHLSQADKDQIPITVDRAFDYIQHRSRGSAVTVDDCTRLSLLAMLLADQVDPVLSGPMMNEPLMDISQRIGLLEASYLETLAQLEQAKV